MRVLLAEDDDQHRARLSKIMQSWGIAVEPAIDGLDALEKLSHITPHVLLTDLMMPRVNGFELLKRLQSQGTLPPSIVMTAFGDIETAVRTIHDLGAYWFLEKPIQPAVLKVLLDRAAAQSRLAEEAEVLQRRLRYEGILQELVGACPAMQQVYSLIQQVAPSKASVLITGESGTGKELVARAIHRLSRRREGPFVALNCAALPESLIESELFGHEKGAFTDAIERRTGCFELADHGTLLLDELAEMPTGTQAKLLRVLEDSSVRRLGGRNEISVDVRVIASTNKILEDALKKNELREDLYYRLNVFHICLPALRQRIEDVPLLAASLVETLNRKHDTRVADVHADVLERFQRYSWPGNVRELRNTLERAVIVAGEGTILPQHLPPDFGLPSGSAPLVSIVEPGMVHLPFGTTVKEAEKALIMMTTKHANKTRAAEILGLSLKTLFNKLKEYGGGEKSAAR
ncbi:MAG TPA: sigma-54 dependent transcriptional regulator [Bryobacteraceae bacterium]|nr:sigma-54 dependent transcriptional regulator [Bryobacteraceae bacterium]